MKYLFLICVEEGVQLGAEDAAAVGPDTERWVEETTRSGARIMGNRLEEVSQSRCVRIRNRKPSTTDGPFAETKEQIAGFDVIECEEMDEAIRIAARHPVARFGTIEIRPFWRG
ncbi:MAG TPA: YciI family protein [Candidatus Baltobacteraceae bacterium]|nr:YciI family protein [Candidatus Baltobacteraceae bacterium]